MNKIEMNLSNSLLNSLFTIANYSFKTKNYSYTDHSFLQKNISLMQEEEADRWNKLQVVTSRPLDMIYSRWIDFLFPEGKRIVPDTISPKQFEQIDYHSLSIYQGLAGIGLSFYIDNSFFAREIAAATESSISK